MPERMSQPELEVVGVTDDAPLKVWSHGYPFRTVRWHFHPELEIHYTTATSGRYFVGDYIGDFSPGHLVMTGPNLPHNWLSDVPPGVVIAQRCIVLQFAASFIEACASAFRTDELLDLVAESRRGLEFSASTALAVGPLMAALLEGDARSRPALFMQIVERLLRDDRRRNLASVGYRSEPDRYMSAPLNHVLEHIERNLAFDLRETELAQLCGYTPSAFSRAFRRRTGVTFVAYVNGMRINRACLMLTTSDRPITDICFDVGFNNVSNFNRRFLAVTSMTPRSYRVRHRENDRHRHDSPRAAGRNRQDRL
jgi:AraC-like DNA-binding protein